MDVRFVDSSGAHDHDSDDIVELLLRDDGFVWVDVPAWDEQVEGFLAGLGCHPLVVASCRERNHLPTVHAYPDHYFITLHTPLHGEASHVHMLELDLIIAPSFLVTVHGPLNPVVDPKEALTETNGVLNRINAGRFVPTSPAEVAYAVASAVARQQRALIGDVAEKIPELEEHVMAPQLKEPEQLLERMFLVRHELIIARTMASQTRDVYARITSLGRFVDEADRGFAQDLADQFGRVASIGDGEWNFVFAVIELYQTRVNTKMTLAMERLAVIAAVTLPVTAIASVYGMNVIVNDSTHYGQLSVVLVVMVTISFLLLRWARKQGWW
ncbi:MAG TPA: CorA family divalent cation transporter [Nocardioides sp.]|nr:CorA family divalent cation transporter [Nocardioides sp.]